ncbi:alpha-amylase family glycosyl hydrolase [Portibacter lacus]|uniref:alpha-amylase family glycosyl hydrolase n=1 Tax=Portibacter lacus TaxID=1099794 RepID=UPI001F423B5D|nr:alpha-amylase family glycosyl hydrolase [Portibacter lacus]
MPIFLTAQNFTTSDISNGYALDGDDVVFLFSENVYDVQPEKVVVTGSFRGWSQDMDDMKWQLNKEEDYWTLKVKNVNFEQLKPQDGFKYRINNGQWLDPPRSATNAKGGNLILMNHIEAPYLKAEIIDNRTLWVTVRGMDKSFVPSDYELKDWKGKEIKIDAVLPNTEETLLVHTSESFDKKRVHYFSFDDVEVTCSFDGWYRMLYSDKHLGANVSEDKKTTDFRVFSPRATSVKLFLYKDGGGEAYDVQEMQEDESSVWEYKAKGDLAGIYYDFKVEMPDFEEYDGHVSDPYARVQDGSFGRSRVTYATKAATPLKNGIPAMEDVVAYEVHLIDFTDQLPVDDQIKGKMPAMIKTGLKNTRNEAIGFDYLLDLGVNVLHLMPMQEFFNYPEEVWKASFQDDEYMKKYGIAEENYQWGYRTTHAFAVESTFRSKGEEPGKEREEFRDLVQAFHEKDIAVIIDIVPNHTGEDMDGGSNYLNFNVFGKDYYYRTKNFKHIGAFGNEVKTENRPMVQRWLIDQCKHWIEEFGVDGFRIDLAGQIDRQTLIALRKALGDDIIIYGEPWIGSNDPDFEANPSWDWYKHNAPITFFQDDSRTAFKGTTNTPVNKQYDRGWPGGNYAFRGDVMKALSGGFPDDTTLLSGINYLDIHDNWALADQFALHDWDGRKGVDENRYKMAALLLHTSLGPIVLHGGSEFMRSKGLAELREVVKVMNDGQELAFHGKGDTYNMRLPNNFIWENVGSTEICDYKGMHDYWQGLIKFRLSEEGAIFRLAEHPHYSYFHWIAPRDEKALGYIIADRVLVLLNSAEYDFTFYIHELSEGNWKLIGNNEAFDHVKGVSGDYSILKGGDHAINLPPEGMRVWVKQ